MTVAESQDALAKRGREFLERVGDFWLRIPFGAQILLVVALLLAKNAVDIELRNVQEAYLPGAQQFPTAVGYFSASFGQVLLAQAIGVSTTLQWVVLHGVLVVLALAVAVFLIRQGDEYQRGFLLLVIASATATSSLFLSIGKYDVITYLGGVVLALSRTLPVAVGGAFIMSSGNPEQAGVASVALLVLSLAKEFRQVRVRATLALAISVGVWLGVQLWFATSGVDSGRAQLVYEYLAESLARVASFPGTAAWSWFNAGWILVFLIVLLASTRSRKWIILSLVLIPGIATVTTADGGRVFGSIALPAYLVAAVWFSRRVIDGSQTSRALVGAAVCALVLLPVTIVGEGWLFNQVFGLFSRLI